MTPQPTTPRKSVVHKAKSHPEYFRAVISGRKRFEIRRDDREPCYMAGDVIHLQEFDPYDAQGNMTAAARGFTGRSAMFWIGYISRGGALPAGWCAFEIVSAEEINRVALATGTGVGS